MSQYKESVIYETENLHMKFKNVLKYNKSCFIPN